MEAKPEIIERYMTESESWERDQRVYVEAFSEDPEAFEAALAEVDHEDMVATWDSRTLRKVVGSGTLLAFNRNQARSIRAAAIAEWSERSGPVPTGHGMGADQRQA